jgi:hypothetical protein
MLFGLAFLNAQNPSIVARIKYDGGGDWYGNQTTFVNIFNFMKKTLQFSPAVKEDVVSLKNEDCFQYPILYIAGHGNIKLNAQEVKQLRNYLVNGGFLWADDDYGMDKSFRREMEKVFPDAKWVPIPFNHPIFHIYFDFPKGLPKIHEHAGGPPQALGLFYNGRMVCFYSFNTDISDGCENPEIHHDPPEKRLAALRFATNLILYCLIN